MKATISAGLFGFAAVALGAFGAHGLRGMLPENALSTYQTAVQYHLVHAVVLVSIALQSPEAARALRWATRLFEVGIALFSGSLYLLAITDMKGWGWLTPIGGLCFLGGWAAISVHGLKRSSVAKQSSGGCSSA